MKFLDYARALVAETISHSYVALDQHYITAENMRSVHNQADVTWKKINGFITYLKSCD